MKIKIICFLLIFFNTYTKIDSPLLVVTIMVKDEEHVITATLEPFVKNGVDSFLIFDTGSTDKTIETVDNYFKKNNITNYYIIQEPFIDFATSRNRGLDLAKEKFPTAKFLLMPDAEWYLQNTQGLLEFCKQHESDPIEDGVYLIRMISNPNSSFYHSRLLRMGCSARFRGVVHETIASNGKNRVPDNVFFTLGTSKFGIEKSKKRWEIDLKKINKEMEEYPETRIRNMFYKAQTLACLGNIIEAYELYLERSKLSGFDEENYETFYRLGDLTEKLSKENKNFTWDMAYNYYITAYKLRPHRVEPLVRIAEHYWPENIPMSFLFIKQALELPYPKDDVLFVDPSAYNFVRYEIASKTAWHCKAFEIGEFATRKALEICPSSPYLYRNLACYLEIKNAK